MIADENKEVLEKALGKLLGFEEGEAEDLLDHLFSIESEEDLSEYLAQLLGGNTPEVSHFVDSVSRHRKGECLSSRDGGDDKKEAPSKPPAGEDTAALDSFRMMALGKNTVETPKRGTNSGRKKEAKSRVPPPKKKYSGKQTQEPAKTTTSVAQTSIRSKPQSYNTQPEEKKEEETTVVKKFHPSRGKAKVVCGCFGSKHKALTNCLYCGRICCEAEGYGFCPFCGFMIEAPVAGGSGKAFQQKERLLRFDRDFARRTEVFDDQADYQGPATWMTEEEQKEAEANEQKHLETLKRPKQKLSLVL
ncbi:unnamed protein product [Pseudo-nitzschia multistriata]|uniref:Uncharacterized protein n=1 Tax=Pseudo-nitzschia multistriata TaxID=183589 RepID=A0A448Z8V1_9STRA|nr:unnamed protein product [Pseudo-nitzschia multistriata]